MFKSYHDQQYEMKKNQTISNIVFFSFLSTVQVLARHVRHKVK